MRPGSAEHPAYVLIILLNILAVIGHTVGTAIITPSSRECLLDDDGTNLLVERCLRKGDFVEKYLRHVRTNKRWQYLDTCAEFMEFAQCIAPLMENCQGVQRAHHHWKVIYDAMKCVCNGTTNCQQDLQCFEEQYGGVLARRCDAMYRFNVRQQTKDRCYFTAENIRCKENLVRSACGASAGELAFHLFKLSARRHARKRICVIPHQPKEEYTGFQYDANCPDDFPKRLEECRATYLSHATLNFHDDNELVAIGKRKDIKRTCRAYKAYKRCTRPIRDSCKKGANLISDYDGKLRTYALKMDYICNDVKKEYMHHMPCYRQVLRNESFKWCDSTWKTLKPLLNSIKAHEYYCHPEMNATKHLHKVLDQLRSCYERVFVDGCGAEGGDIISGLMWRAFQDPYYLRFKYQPDCKLHRLPGPVHAQPRSATHSGGSGPTPRAADTRLRRVDVPAGGDNRAPRPASAGVPRNQGQWLLPLGAAILYHVLSRTLVFDGCHSNYQT